MFRGLFLSAHPFVKLIFSMIIILMLGITFSFIGIYFAAFIYDLDKGQLQKLLQGELDLSNVSILKILQVAQTTGMFLIPAIILSYLFSSKGINYIGVSVSPNISTAFLSAFLIIAAIPFVNFLAEINQNLVFPNFLSGFEDKLKDADKQYEVLLKRFLQFDSKKDLFVNLIVIGILPSIAEEFVFRGLIQKLFIDWTKRKHLSIFITSILFSSIHFQIYGFLPRLFLGLLLGYLFLWSKTIWIPVIAHFINNSCAVVYFFFHSRGKTISVDPESIGTTNNMLYYAIISSVIIFLILYVIYYFEKRKGGYDISVFRKT